MTDQSYCNVVEWAATAIAAANYGMQQTYHRPPHPHSCKQAAALTNKLL
jgi:hypothetical protein